MKVPLSGLAVWTLDGKLAVEPGAVIVKIGTSADTFASGNFTLV